MECVAYKLRHEGVDFRALLSPWTRIRGHAVDLVALLASLVTMNF